MRHIHACVADAMPPHRDINTLEAIGNNPSAIAAAAAEATKSAAALNAMLLQHPPITPAAATATDASTKWLPQLLLRYYCHTLAALAFACTI